MLLCVETEKLFVLQLLTLYELILKMRSDRKSVITLSSRPPNLSLLAEMIFIKNPFVLSHDTKVFDVAMTDIF